MKSIFIDKNITPTPKDLKRALGTTYTAWKTLADFVIKSAPASNAEWSFSGTKFGWSFRIRDKKRVLIYLLPRDGFFKAAFVFGQLATSQILKSDCDESIRTELKNAKVYGEGRGIRIEVKNGALLNDLKKLILIKVKN